MDKKIMTVAKVEAIMEEGKQVGKLVSDNEGNSLKVKKGQGGKLEARWGELTPGKTFEFEMGEFKGYPFVADFSVITLSSVETVPHVVTERETRSQTTNASIESQVAVKAITELWIADKLKDDSPEVIACRQWFLGRLPCDLPELTMLTMIVDNSRILSKPSTQTNPLVSTLTDMGGVVKSVIDTGTSVHAVVVEKDREFKNAGEFLMEAYKTFGLTSAKVCKLLGVNTILEVKDLTGAWVFLTTLKEKQDEEIAAKKIQQKAS